MHNFDTLHDRSHTGSLKWDKYKNSDILPLWVADMDFHSAEVIKEALKKHTEHGIFGYTKPYPEVENAVVNYLKREHQVEAKAEWLVWMPGLVPALNVASAAFGNEDSEVLTCTPVYPPFLSAPVWQSKKLVTSALKEEGDRWTFDFEDLEKKVTPRTKLFILCNPHNPVGRVYTREELEKVAEFCIRHDLILCSDEIHCDLLFDGNKHISATTLGEEIADRTLTLMAPSKTYNLPGLACAYIVIQNPKLRAAFEKAARGFITEVNCFGYVGCSTAYNEGEPWRQELLTYLQSNRDYLEQFVKEKLPEMSMTPMEATYLAWLNVEKLNLDTPDAYFEKYGVGLSSGTFFGDKRYLRLNFGCPRETLTKALQRMQKAVAALRL